MNENPYLRNLPLHTPLSRAAEQELFARHRAGDVEAGLTIINNTLRWAAALAGQQVRRDPRHFHGQLDDLIGEAVQTLIKCLDDKEFNPGRCRFATFVTKPIESILLKYRRVYYGISYPVGAPLPRPGDRVIYPEPEALPDLASFCPEEIDQLQLEEALAILDTLQRQVLYLIFFERETIVSIARLIGRRREEVYRIRTKALHLLRRHLLKRRFHPVGRRSAAA